jgi:leucyl/phenylalanyl-tRNA--protein transferase
MTSQITFISPKTLDFPCPNQALTDPDGLLAIGGDLSTDRLIHAYQTGIFPWFNEGEPIMWWSPSQRAVLPIGSIKISRSLKKLANKNMYTAKVNCNFIEVIQGCIEQRANKEGTWINTEMLDAYINLHKLGFAHSIEIYNQANRLVGGLYGVMVNDVFCGESMFHTESNCSKLAFWALHNHLKNNNVRLIDCQIENAHLSSLGAETVTRDEFLSTLKKTSQICNLSSLWRPVELINIYD